MTDLVPITDHSRRALLNINGPFQGKPRLASLIWAFTEEVQILENAIQSVITLRQIDAAGIEQLKIIGKLVGERYASQATATYRAYVKTRILVNRSGGTINDLLRVVQLLSTAIPRWWIENTNQIAIALQNDSVVNLDGINRMLRDAKKANEGLYLYHTTLATGLRWDRASASSPATGGWGRASNAAIGGKIFRVRNQ